MKSAVPRISPVIASIVLISSAPAQTWEREDIGFSDIQSRAKDLANKAYVAPNRDRLPIWITQMSKEQYQDIQFNPNQALWATEKLPFRAMFFHPGYLYSDPVVLNEFTSTHQQRIRLAEAYFNYGPRMQKHGELPPDGGFAGFRLHAALNDPAAFDELISFQGGTAWRALGKGQRYGVQSLGIAVDTGIEGSSEEALGFREFWLRKPDANDTKARVYALLDGPSFAGAYEFTIHPGNETLVDVRAVLFARRAVKRLGVAPLSGMFWFGENSRRRFDDYRPEVHDCDGLAIRMGSGERVWRPISNDSNKPELSIFEMEKCVGFGLLQRDRRFAAYEDPQANYQIRPSVWIEPTSDWGPGRVILMESPATHEQANNTMAMWEPSRPPQPGERLEFAYRQHWTTDLNPSQAGAVAVATRSGLQDPEGQQRTVIVEFAGSTLNQAGEAALTAQVDAVGADAAKVKIDGITVKPLPDERSRVTFQISPASAETRLNQIGPVELRCSLKRGDNFLTETWAQRVTP